MVSYSLDPAIISALDGAKEAYNSPENQYSRRKALVYSRPNSSSWVEIRWHIKFLCCLEEVDLWL